MSGKGKWRLHVVDDHPSIHYAIQSILDPLSYEITAYTSSSRMALDHARKYSPDAIILDLNLKEGCGEDILRFYRLNSHKPSILLFTGVRDMPRIQRCLDMGALGYLGKGAGVREIQEAIETTVVQKRRYLCSCFRNEHHASALLDTPLTCILTKRELEVARNLARSLVNKEIADKMGINVVTVQAHRANLLRKLKVKGSAALTRLVLSQGL